jgi:hypothetical protein
MFKAFDTLKIKEAGSTEGILSLFPLPLRSLLSLSLYLYLRLSLMRLLLL